MLTRAWRAVAFVTHEEQDLTLCTLMVTLEAKLAEEVQIAAESMRLAERHLERQL